MILVLILGLVATGAGCGDAAAPTSVGTRQGTLPPPRQGTSQAAPRQGTGGTEGPAQSAEERERERQRNLDAAMARSEEMKRDYDRQAHALIARFHDVVYDPSRDGALSSAAGTIDLEVDGHKAAYRFAFDASVKDPQSQVTLTTVHQDAGIHPESAQNAKRFAVLAARGPYSFVVAYDPPIQWYVTQAKDGHMIAVAPQFRSSLGVAYRIDPRGCVEMRGATTGKQQSRTVFEWTAHAERWLLAKAVDDGGLASVEYAYAEEKGIVALRKATLTEGSHKFVASLTWERIATR